MDDGAAVIVAMPGFFVAAHAADGLLHSVRFLEQAGSREPASPTGEQFRIWLEHWLEDPFLAGFHRPPLAPATTAFQGRLRGALLEIEPGCPRSYSELAVTLGSSPRAVGKALACNPLPLIVPCHRVVNVRGLGGFMGQQDGFAIQVKEWLLEHEGEHLRRRRSLLGG